MGCYEAARRKFNEILHAHPCLACGSMSKIEADHIIPYSLKTYEFSKRSHKGLSYFYAVPLCAECHRSKTDSIEEEWYKVMVPGGMRKAYAVALALSLRAWSEACLDYKSSD